ncbi:MAG: hypothetical protein R3F43_09765 [bacterium]
MDGDDGGVVQPGEDATLLPEAIRVGVILGHLDGDHAAQDPVAGTVGGTHAALAELRTYRPASRRQASHPSLEPADFLQKENLLGVATAGLPLARRAGTTPQSRRCQSVTGSPAAG